MLTSLLAGTLAHAAPPTLASPPAPAHAGAALTFTLKGDPKAHLLVDGCAPVELERRDGEKWLPVAVAVCPTLVPAMEVSTSLALSVTVPSEGTWRGRVSWGTGCADKRPFILSSCSTLGAATSDEFEVAP